MAVAKIRVMSYLFCPSFCPLFAKVVAIGIAAAAGGA
jgi:hypothetical protein